MMPTGQAAIFLLLRGDFEVFAPSGETVHQMQKRFRGAEMVDLLYHRATFGRSESLCVAGGYKKV